MTKDYEVLLDTIARLQVEGFPDILEWSSEDVADDLISFETHFESWTPGTLIPLIDKAKDACL